MSAAPLERLLADATTRLSTRVLDEMWADPFWAERYADRGRENMRKDGDFHIQYLIEALHGGAQVFVAYAGWLRELLHSHGMCSRHLAENFERLAAAIDEEPWPDRGRARAVLQAGIDALVHREGDAGAIDAARPALVRAAAAELDAWQPGWRAPWGEAGRRRGEDQLDHHLSYLADALASGSTVRFENHAAFTARMFASRGLPLGNLAAELGELADASTQAPGVSDRVTAYLREASKVSGQMERP